MYTVKQVAEKLRLSEHAIRFYTDKGLIPNLKRDKNNIRLFDEQSLHWLNGVKYLKECGMSIAAIKDFMDLCVEGNSTLHTRYEILKASHEIAKKRLEDAKYTADYMERKLKHYEQIMNQSIPDDMNPQLWE